MYLPVFNGVSQSDGGLGLMASAFRDRSRVEGPAFVPAFVPAFREEVSASKS